MKAVDSKSGKDVQFYGLLWFPRLKCHCAKWVQQLSMCAMFASGRAVSGPVPTVHGARFHRWPHPDSSRQTSAGPWQGPGLSHRMIVADRGVPADWSLSWVSCVTASRLLLSDVSWTMAKPWVFHQMIDQAMCTNWSLSWASWATASVTFDHSQSHPTFAGQHQSPRLLHGVIGCVCCADRSLSVRLLYRGNLLRVAL